jgi:predicted O-methyltransferase YrrM
MSGDSRDVLPALRHTFDMIFVDGDHSEAGCLADLNAVLPLLDISGCIYVDDMDHPAHTYLRGAVLNWAVENALRHTIHEDGYGVMELRR